MLSPRAKYYFSCFFSITKWTETGGDEYECEVELSRIKGGEGGSKSFVVAIEKAVGEELGASGSSRQTMSCRSHLGQQSWLRANWAGPAVLCCENFLARQENRILKKTVEAEGRIPKEFGFLLLVWSRMQGTPNYGPKMTRCDKTSPLPETQASRKAYEKPEGFLGRKQD